MVALFNISYLILFHGASYFKGNSSIISGRRNKTEQNKIHVKKNTHPHALNMPHSSKLLVKNVILRVDPENFPHGLKRRDKR